MGGSKFNAHTGSVLSARQQFNLRLRRHIDLQSPSCADRVDIVHVMIPYICMVSARHRLPPASTDGPTARQLKIAAYVERALASGRAPSRKDIAEYFGFNRATAQQHV